MGSVQFYAFPDGFDYDLEANIEAALSLCIYVYMCIYIYMYICIYTYIYIYIVLNRLCDIICYSLLYCVLL